MQVTVCKYVVSIMVRFVQVQTSTVSTLTPLSIDSHIPIKFPSHPDQLHHPRRLKLLKDSKFAALQCPIDYIDPKSHSLPALSGNTISCNGEVKFCRSR
jgi:hypothetical protein